MTWYQENRLFGLGSQAKNGIRKRAKNSGATPDEVVMRVAHGEAWCSSCERWLLRELFSPNGRTYSGTTSWCKECRNRQARDASRRANGLP